MHGTTNKIKEKLHLRQSAATWGNYSFHSTRQTKIKFYIFSDEQLVLTTQVYMEASAQKLDCVFCQVAEDNIRQLKRKTQM